MNAMLGILPFRTSGYCLAIYRNGTNRLTARDGFTGPAAGYYPYIEQYASTYFNLSELQNALAMTYINDKEYFETIALIPLPTPIAPTVTADDVNNVILGITNKMEYSKDGEVQYTKYSASTIPDLSGDHTVRVRLSAVASVSNAGLDTTLTYTKNPPVPIKPSNPTVTADDINNVIIGMNTTMEYSLDGVTYVAYNATTNLDLSGDKTVKVRVAAEGINPASDIVTLIFTTNPVTPPAPNVTNDNVTNKVMGMAEGMEYSIDGSINVIYNAIIFDMIDFSGDHTIVVRVAAYGINPCGLPTTLVFTTNPITPPAPTVSIDDSTNKVVGMTTAMEYDLDASGYVKYVDTVFDVIDFSGNHALLVRIAAEGINPCGTSATLAFTTNVVTPGIPVLTLDDVANTVSGMMTGMEYNLDGTGYVTYEEATFDAIDFSGEHTLLVRIAAEGINPFGPDKTLTFTAN